MPSHFFSSFVSPPQSRDDLAKSALWLWKKKKKSCIKKEAREKKSEDEQTHTASPSPIPSLTSHPPSHLNPVLFHFRVCILVRWHFWKDVKMLDGFFSLVLCLFSFKDPLKARAKEQPSFAPLPCHSVIFTSGPYKLLVVVLWLNGTHSINRRNSWQIVGPVVVFCQALMIPLPFAIATAAAGTFCCSCCPHY